MPESRRHEHLHSKYDFTAYRQKFYITVIWQHSLLSSTVAQIETSGLKYKVSWLIDIHFFAFVFSISFSHTLTFSVFHLLTCLSLSFSSTHSCTLSLSIYLSIIYVSLIIMVSYQRHYPVSLSLINWNGPSFNLSVFNTALSPLPLCLPLHAFNC